MQRSQSKSMVGEKQLDCRVQLRYQSVTDITTNAQNPRIHSKKQLAQIAQSLQTFGFLVPIIIDGKNQIVCGHGRLEAAKLLGAKEVPIIQVEHLTEEQIRAFAIADNRLTENAAWDEKLLGEQLRILAEAKLDFNLEVTGFEMAEIDLYIEGIGSAKAEEAADELPASSEVLVSTLGSLWQLGQHHVCCGDARYAASYTNLLRKADLVFTDPPYNVRIQGHAGGLGHIQHQDFQMASGEMSQQEFTTFLQEVFSALYAKTDDGSIHFVCMDWRHAGEILASGTKVYGELKNICVWVKDNAGMGSLYRSQHELVFVFKKGHGSHRNNIQLGKFGRYRSNVWQYPSANSFSRSGEEGNLLALHPTVKPVAMVADAIFDCSARGDIVLDPFLGSGTSLIAAERTGRTCYGIELDPHYVDVAIRRWQRFTGKQAVESRTGRTFDSLQKEAEHGR